MVALLKYLVKKLDLFGKKIHIFLKYWMLEIIFISLIT